MLDLSVSNQEIKINGYDIVRKDRNRHGGGVAIYIRTSINFIIRDDLTDDNLETITLEISKPKAKPFLISSWYKPPNTTLEIFNAFEDLITRMDSENKEIILLGDYNCDWSRLDSNSANAQTNKLAGIAQTFQFQQLISDPTRITANSKTLIDLAFTNKPELINGSGVIHLGISDHSLIYIQKTISVPRKEPKVIKSRNFKHYNSNNFKSDFSTYLYDQIFCDTILDPNIMWENLCLPKGDKITNMYISFPLRKYHLHMSKYQFQSKFVEVEKKIVKVEYKFVEVELKFVEVEVEIRRSRQTNRNKNIKFIG